MALGHEVRQMREKAGLSTREVSERLGHKSTSLYNDIENGKRPLPDEQVKAYAEALETDVHKLSMLVLRYQMPWVYAVLMDPKGLDKRLRDDLENFGTSKAQKIRTP